MCENFKMSFEEGLRENAALLSTIGAAAALKNQSEQKAALNKQNDLIKEQLDTEKKKLALEEMRLEEEREYRSKQDEYARLKERTIKEVRKALLESDSALNRIEAEIKEKQKTSNSGGR